ncbi:hypothetical protein [Paenibacillus glycinis]|uniref:Uncharacterized protein n=1 Tax=Paenibacillus glycinis TaxID=2697035 RepID=A0ABW9XPK9_9BACL|nr:hypothetical protein [Paenibacillus glycinis]NBD24312.1 hypothetical protein [Paenibacillus glycinis]
MIVFLSCGVVTGFHETLTPEDEAIVNYPDEWVWLKEVPDDFRSYPADKILMFNSRQGLYLVNRPLEPTSPRSSPEQELVEQLKLDNVNLNSRLSDIELVLADILVLGGE